MSIGWDTADLPRYKAQDAIGNSYVAGVNIIPADALAAIAARASAGITLIRTQ